MPERAIGTIEETTKEATVGSEHVERRSEALASYPLSPRYDPTPTSVTGSGPPPAVVGVGVGADWIGEAGLVRRNHRPAHALDRAGAGGAEFGRWREGIVSAQICRMGRRRPVSQLR